MRETECVAFTQDELVQFKQELKDARIEKSRRDGMPQAPVEDIYGEVV